MTARRFSLALGLIGLLASSCSPTLSNKAAVYPSISGVIDMKWNPTVQGAREVEFLLDGTSIGRDTDATDGFQVEIDSTKLANGLHKLTINARDANGSLIKAIEHSVLVQN